MSASQSDKSLTRQPHSFFIWETITKFFDDRIKKMGVKNCSFPLFVSEDCLKKEKDHIEGFAAEVAWVTHAYVVQFWLWVLLIGAAGALPLSARLRSALRLKQ